MSSGLLLPMNFCVSIQPTRKRTTPSRFSAIAFLLARIDRVVQAFGLIDAGTSISVPFLAGLGLDLGQFVDVENAAMHLAGDAGFHQRRIGEIDRLHVGELQSASFELRLQEQIARIVDAVGGNGIALEILAVLSVSSEAINQS